jgi:hypothetical protein
MDTARQILRFSIPGSVLLLHALGCYFLFRGCQGVSFAEASEPVTENIGALVAILATVPIGFVVYQAYYLSYTPVVRLWPLEWGGRIVRADRGWQILRGFDPAQIETLEKIFGDTIEVDEPHDFVPRCGPWYRHPVHKVKRMLGLLEIKGQLTEVTMDKRERQKEYEHRWFFNWDVLRAILDISASVSGSTQIKSEYTTLSDIYHALGATRTAIAWGWVIAMVVALSHRGRIEDGLLGSALGLIVTLAVTLALYLVLHTSRRRTWKSAAASLRLGLRWFFLKYADELGSGLSDETLSESLRTSLRNLREKAVDAVPSRNSDLESADATGQESPFKLAPTGPPRQSWWAIGLAITGVLALAFAVKLTGAQEAGLNPDHRWVSLVLLAPAVIGCFAGFFYARAPEHSGDRAAGWNLFATTTGAFATIFGGILILNPSLPGGLAIVLGVCALLALAARLGGSRQPPATESERKHAPPL